MNPIVKTGVLIGVLCCAWTYVIGFTGWYKDPVMMNMFWMVIVIQIVLLVWGLKKTAAAGKTYGGQVMAGTMMSLVATPIIIVSSIIFTTVVFPNYYEELQVVQEEMLRNAGKSADEIRAELEATAATQKPLMGAILGAVGTIVTGLVASLVIGAFIKKKD